MCRFLGILGFTLLFIISSATGQDTLEIKTDSLQVLPVDSSYANLTDSLWLKNISELRGLKKTQKRDSVTVMLEETNSVFKQKLDSMNEQTPINLAYNPAIEPYIKEYLRYKNQLSKLLALSDQYFPLLETTLDKHDIPLEMKSLSVIESGLNPNARSPRGATGLWQFMLPTARECGLVINSYVDERRDPVKSTEAACIYLNRLYQIYGVWELAIAAYNCGPGNVNKAIRKAGGSNNFWKIRPYLPRETQKYVPRFMAMCYLMEFGEEHGAEKHELNYSFWETDTVMVKKKTRFDQIAAVTSITEEDLRMLNPQFKIGVIPAFSTGIALVLPIQQIPEFLAKQDDILAYKPSKEHAYVKSTAVYNERNDGKRIKYTVRSGDVLGTIAEKHGVSVSQIKRWNGIRGTRIKAGQKLTLYVSESPAAQNTKKSPPPEPVIDNGEYTIHTVRKGDTLWDIAKLYSGVSTDDIKRLNRGINPKNLKTGSKLRIKKI